MHGKRKGIELTCGGFLRVSPTYLRLRIEITMSKARFALLMLCATSCGYAQEFNTTQTALGESDYPIKYAIYSTAWGTNSNAGLRLVTQNQSEHTVSLRSVLFSDARLKVDDHDYGV